MHHYKIASWDNGTILYEGYFPDLKHCIRSAVANGTNLDYADLSGANLSDMDLDEMTLRYILFNNANLRGANITEAKLIQCSFINTDLQAVCFAYSRLESCDFSGALMHGADIAGATLTRNIFSTRSACTLNFTAAERISECLYRHQDETLCSFSRPPIYIQGLEQPLTIFDDCLLVGNTYVRPADLGHANDNI